MTCGGARWVYTVSMLHTDLVSALQLAVSPVILISAVGLLLLAMTNRYAHSTDRARTLSAAARSADPAHKENLKAQLAVIWFRVQLIRHAIECAAGSALASSVLVMLLFLDAAFSIAIPFAVVTLVCTSLLLLCGSLVLLIAEARQAITALSLELSQD